MIYDETIGKFFIPEAITRMGINCGKIIGCSLDNQKIEDFITTFVTYIVFQRIGLFWIIKSNKNLHFDFQNHCTSWILNGPWYNTSICSQLHGLLFEDYFTTSKRDKYDIMCSIEAHGKTEISQQEQTC